MAYRVALRYTDTAELLQAGDTRRPLHALWSSLVIGRQINVESIMESLQQTRVIVLGAAIFGWLMSLSASAQAQLPTQYPTQPIKFIVPNPPGGLPDVLSRIVAERLRVRLGQPIIIENRPGANAGIGAAVVTASKPDGYTFLVSDSAVINISHLLNAQLPFNPKDLMPVTLIARASLFLAAGITLPVNNLKEMVDHLKANPGKINYGSIGVGSFHHLSMEAIQAEFGVKLNHIPYKGSGESVTALRAGHIQLVFASFAGLSPAIKSQQARLIATNGTQRSQQAPEVPTIAETIPGYDLSVTQSLYARAGTPPEIAMRLAAEMAQVVKEPEILERFATMGIEAASAGSLELQRMLNIEAARIEKIVNAAGLKAN